MSFVTDIIGGAMQADAAQSAADTQADAGKYAADKQYEMYNQQRADFKPFRDVGVSANSRLAYLMGLSPNGGATTAAPATSAAPKPPTATVQPAAQAGTQVYPGVYAGSVLSSMNPAQYYDAYQKTGTWAKNNSFEDYLKLMGSWDPVNKKPVGPTADIYGKPVKNVPLTTAQTYSALGNNTAKAPVVTNNASKDPAYGSLARSFSMSDFEQDPGYAFRLNEGQKALERSAAARGGLLSGAQGKAMQRYGQDMGSQEYTNAYNRFNTNQGNLFNRLSSLSGGGQTATSNLATLGANAANNAGNYSTQAANASAAGTIQAGNAWSSGLTSAGDSLFGGGKSMFNLFG